MAPGFFSKLVKSNGEPSTATTTDTSPSTTSRTSKGKSRRSRDRSGSRKPSEDSTYTKPSFISTLKSRSNSITAQSTAAATAHSRATSTPSADTNHAPLSQHTKAETYHSEGLKAEKPRDGQRSRRNSIISVFGGRKDKDAAAAPAPPQLGSVTASNSQQSEDSSVPRISVAHSDSRESLAASSHLGFTVIPPSPLVYTASLASSDDRSERGVTQDNFAADADEDKKEQGPPAVPPTPVTSPTTATEGTTGNSVLDTLFQAGRRARRVSVSSAITGLIGDLPNFVTGNSVDSPTSTVEDTTASTAATSPVTTPTTATTIKAYPFNVPGPDEPVPPLPTDTTMSKSNGGLAPAHEITKKSSTRSLNNIPPPLNLPPHGAAAHTLPRDRSSAHSRAATSPPDVLHPEDPAANGGAGVTMTPIVESPTALKMPEYPNPLPSSTTLPVSAGRPALPERRPTSSGGAGGFVGSFLSPRKMDDDAVSIISTSSKVSPEKKSPWKRNNTKKPTGLAGAIAASGMAFANPGVVVSPVHATPAPPIVTSNSAASKSQPYLSKSPARSTVSTSGRSAKSPVSPKSAKSSARSPGASRHTLNSAGSRNHRRPSVSGVSDGGQSAHSEYYSGSEAGRSRGRRLSRYQSGSESDTESDSDSDSDEDSSLDDDDILDGLDLGDDEMPVTGFAVASNKRNADFHELFPTVPDGDYLIEDYGCALQREILIQGRLYISENHVCFHANIFGWITNLSIPIPEIIALEKKMTAFVIPNAIQINTRQAKYSFASFLSRDTTFDVIHNIWRVSRPDDVQSTSSARGSFEGGGVSTTAVGSLGGTEIPTNGSAAAGIAAAAMAGTMNGGPRPAQQQQKKTQCACGREGRHYTEVAMDTVFPGSPEKIHNLMFASGFIKDFLVTDQKLLDLQMSDWAPMGPGSKLLTRNMSYIKPLNASMGPKQTKCEIKDEVEHHDLDQYVSTITSTRTPDVPSGGVFTVKTRTCIMWASAMSSRVIVSTQVDWSGRSFIKGIIERSAIEGQKTYHGDLERGMRSYIQEHKSEFVPEGMDTTAIEAAAAAPPPELETIKAETNEINGNAAHPAKSRERERNRRAFQWAYDTVEGVWDVAKRSTSGVVELIGDAWDESSSTTILYFVIVILVISNLYTLVWQGQKEDVGRRKELMKAEERERWVQSVVVTLWDELVTGKRDPNELRDQWSSRSASRALAPTPSSTSALAVEPTASTVLSWKEEVVQLQRTLEAVEERVRTIKESIAQLEMANSLESLY